MFSPKKYSTLRVNEWVGNKPLSELMIAQFTNESLIFTITQRFCSILATLAVMVAGPPRWPLCKLLANLSKGLLPLHLSFLFLLHCTDIHFSCYLLYVTCSCEINTFEVEVIDLRFRILAAIWQASGHDDVIKWKHFPRYWPFVLGIHRPPVISPQKGQWRGVLMFS